MNAEMYERTVTANSRLSKWNTNLVLVYKSGYVQPCLTFNYHFSYEDIPAIHMEATIIAYNLLTIPSIQGLFSADIRHGYWVVNIYRNNCHYPAFYVPRIR